MVIPPFESKTPAFSIELLGRKLTLQWEKPFIDYVYLLRRGANQASDDALLAALSDLNASQPDALRSVLADALGVDAGSRRPDDVLIPQTDRQRPEEIDFLSVQDRTWSTLQFIQDTNANKSSYTNGQFYPAIYYETDTATPFRNTGTAWKSFYELDDTGTATAVGIVNMIHRSSGTPAAGFGASVGYQLDSSTNVLRSAGFADVVWSTATNASESADFVVRLMNGGAAAAEKFRITSTGNPKIVGKVSLYNNAAPTNGQLLIGNTASGTFDAATLTGTANQVVVTNAGGSITLSGPQDLATTSSPTFAGLTISSSGGVTEQLNADAGSQVNLFFGSGGTSVSGFYRPGGSNVLRLWTNGGGDAFELGTDSSVKFLGNLKVGNRTAAAVPANFVANDYFVILDKSGNTMVVPCMTGTW